MITTKAIILIGRGNQISEPLGITTLLFYEMLFKFDFSFLLNLWSPLWPKRKRKGVGGGGGPCTHTVHHSTSGA